MRFTDFTPYDIILLAQGLGVTVALFLVTSVIGAVIGALWRSSAITAFRASSSSSPSSPKS